MKSNLDYATFRLALMRQCREAYRIFCEDYPNTPLLAKDEEAAEWLDEKLLLRAPVTLPKVKGVYLLARNP